MEISRPALRHNVAAFRERLTAANGQELVAVVKANAYGHGVATVVEAVDDLVDRYQIDDIEELRELRPLTSKPIHVYGYVAKADLGEAVELGGIMSLYDPDRIEFLGKLGIPCRIHVKFDALLGREGVTPEELPDVIAAIPKYPSISVEQVYAHFANLEDTTDLVHAEAQAGVYRSMLAEMRQAFGKASGNLAATSGILAMPDTVNQTSVRLGIGLYGLYPSAAMARSCSELSLRPALRWVTHLGQVKVLPAGHPVGYGLTYRALRDMKVGMVPLGYSDGVDRGLSNVGEVLVHGILCPMIGRVAMNMFAIDLSSVPEASSEDEVVLLGEQGSQRISAEEVAAQLGTISYEVISRINSRLPRRLV